MNNAREAFLELLADIVDTLQYGEKLLPWDKGKSPRRSSRKYRGELTRLNGGLRAARDLGVISQETPLLSTEEKGVLIKVLKGYNSLENPEGVRGEIFKTLRDRGIPQELLVEVEVAAKEIADEMVSGKWGGGQTIF